VILYLLTRLALVARLMPLRAAYAVAVLIADCCWLLLRGARRAATENLTQVLGDGQAARTAARRAFRNYARYLVDMVRVPKSPAPELAEKVRYHDWRPLDEAFAEGRGVIFILMHCGNWDLGGAALAARGYPMNVVARTFPHQRLNRLVVRTRQRHGLRVIPRERAAIGIARALLRNQGLALLIDEPEEESVVAVPFFGRLASFPAGPARLALRTGARMIPVAAVRADPSADDLLGLVDFTVRYTATGDDEADVRALTARVVAAHEAFIRAYPEQWFMFRPMWSPAPQTKTAESALATES
jgi:KDO2-lipid IV(A) lauroyltransferase